MENDPQKSDQQPTVRKSARDDEAKRVVEEYAASLRAVIEKLRRKIS